MMLRKIWQKARILYISEMKCYLQIYDKNRRGAISLFFLHVCNIKQPKQALSLMEYSLILSEGPADSVVASVLEMFLPLPG